MKLKLCLFVVLAMLCGAMGYTKINGKYSVQAISQLTFDYLSVRPILRICNLLSICTECTDKSLPSKKFRTNRFLDSK